MDGMSAPPDEPASRGMFVGRHLWELTSRGSGSHRNEEVGDERVLGFG
jgi:hypothetical protein